MSAYIVEIYDAEEFADNYPELLEIIQDKLEEEEVEDKFFFAQCLQVDDDLPVEVTYLNEGDEDESAFFSFDNFNTLLEFSIEKINAWKK